MTPLTRLQCGIAIGSYMPAFNQSRRSGAGSQLPLLGGWYERLNDRSGRDSAVQRLETALWQTTQPSHRNYAAALRQVNWRLAIEMMLIDVRD
jgi:hypothetical protein